MAATKFTAFGESDLLPVINRNASAIPAARVVGGGTAINAGEIAVDTIAVAGVAKGIGITQGSIAAAGAGDIAVGGVSLAKSDGSAVIAVGDKLTYDTAGRVLKAIPGAGVNSHIIGTALTAAAATVDADVHVKVGTSVLQG